MFVYTIQPVVEPVVSVVSCKRGIIEGTGKKGNGKKGNGRKGNGIKGNGKKGNTPGPGKRETQKREIFHS